MFEFELQPLLDARQTQEELKQKEMADALRRCDEEKAALDEVRRRRLQMIREYGAFEGRPVSGLQLQLYSENIAKCREWEIMQEERCRQAETAAEEKRRDLIEASKQKKILEKLKEKKYSAYLQGLYYKENKELDESAILRFGGTP